MDKIKDAMRRQCSHYKPQRPPEAQCRSCQECSAHQRLKNERMRGCAHDRKQSIVRRDDYRDGWIEATVPVQALRSVL